MVGHDAAETTGGNEALLIEHGAALQEDHLAVHEVGAAAVGDVGQQSAPGTADMVGQALLGDGDVLGAAGGTTGLAEVCGQARPQHILLAEHDAFHVGPEPLVITQGDRLHQIGVRAYLVELVLATEKGVAGKAHQLVQHRLLRGHRVHGTAHHLLGGPAGIGQGDSGFQ